MKNYYRVILGKHGKFAEECYQGGYIGLYSKLHIDATGDRSASIKEFKEKYIPLLTAERPERTRLGIGMGCGYLYTIVVGMQRGDTVLCPDGKGKYLVGEISSDYVYQPNEKINHRRKVEWRVTRLERSAMSEQLQRLTGIPHSIVDLTKRREELELLLLDHFPHSTATGDEGVEDLANFALESHLEDFLIQNWPHTELGARYDIYEEDGELVGQQYPSDTGPMDILAISKDRRELLVVELKKGRASDVVVGQVQRYMGYVKAELAEPNQAVKGVIIAHEADLRIRRSLEVAQNIEFYQYEVSFRLIKTK